MPYVMNNAIVYMDIHYGGSGSRTDDAIIMQEFCRCTYFPTGTIILMKQS